MARRKRLKTGLPPGSVVFTGSEQVDHVRVHYLEFNPEEYLEEDYSHDDFDLRLLDSSTMQWYDVRGLHEIKLIEMIGSLCNMHPLVKEDIVDVSQRPKFDEFDEGIFLSLRALSFDSEKKKVLTEQVSLYFGDGYLFSFQEKDDDLLKHVRERVKNALGRIRKSNSDYLAYAIIDNVVDHYYLVLDEIFEEITIIEESISSDSNPATKSKILNLKRQLQLIRKSIFPLREVLSQYAKTNHPILNEQTAIYIRDVHDHLIQIMDSVEGQRDLLSALQDLYNSEIGFKMNKIMQFLTIITTIFVPISFLAGLYGMNFVNIPELQSQNGYYYLLLAMALIAITLLFIFRKKKWF